MRLYGPAATFRLPASSRRSFCAGRQSVLSPPRLRCAPAPPLQEIVEYLKKPEKFTKLGGKLPKGVLLVGPPGEGALRCAAACALQHSRRTGRVGCQQEQRGSRACKRAAI